MATRANLSPFAAEFPATNFPQLLPVNGRPALAFDASASESAYWTFPAPAGITGTLTLVLSFTMASATSGNVIMQASVEAITDGDTTNLASSTSFDTANSTAATAVPGTAGYLKQVTVTLTNADSIVAGDYVRIAVTRDAANVGDTATGDLYLFTAEFRDTA